MISYFKRRIRSFQYALRGAAFLVGSQPNAQIHLGVTAVVVVLGFFFRLDRLEWCLLIVAVMAVWVAEGMNTAFEALADAVRPEHHPLIGRAKDVAAAAVLFAVLGAILIGLIVLGRHIL